MRFFLGTPGELLRLMVWYPFRWGISYLPPGMEVRLLRNLNRAYVRRKPGLLERVETNIRRAFPEREDVRMLAIECLERRLEDTYQGISFEHIDRSTLPDYLVFEGLTNLDEALSRGKGCILAFPHCGPTLLTLFGLGILQYPLALITASANPPTDSPAALAAFHVRRHLESLVPAAMLDAKLYLRPTLRRLKDGEVVMVTYDGSGRGDEVGRREVVRFFGKDVLFPVGAIYLALKSGAPLLPIITLPDRGFAAYKTVISPELVLEERGDTRSTLRHNAQRLASMLEVDLRDHPGAWLLWPEFEPGRMIVSSGREAA